MALGSRDDIMRMKVDLGGIRLHVARIPWHVDKETFVELFSKCGPIQEFELKSDKRFPSQVGTVQFSTIEASMLAMLLYHNTAPYFMKVAIDRNYYFSMNRPKPQDLQRVTRSSLIPNSGCQRSQPSDTKASSEACIGGSSPSGDTECHEVRKRNTNKNQQNRAREMARMPSKFLESGNSIPSLKPILKETSHFQLPALQLNHQKEYPISLSFLDRDGYVYVQVSTEENLHRLHAIAETLDAICESRLKAPKEQLKISIPQMLCAKCTENNRWYRCEVLNIRSRQSIEVRFVDHGHKRLVTASRLIEIPEEYRRYPPIAVSVSLDDIPAHLLDQAVNILERETQISWKMRVINEKSRPISVIVLSSEDRLLKDFAMESSTSTTSSEVEFKPRSLPIQAVEMQAKSLDLNESHVEKLSLCPTVTTTEKGPSAVYYYDDVEIASLPVGRTVTVMFASVTEPHIMYCWAGNLDAVVDRLEKLCDQMTATFERELSTDASDNYIPDLEEVCAAKFKDGQWYRAVCLEKGQSDCRVFYVDYGNLAIVPYSQIRRIGPDFMKEPIQGIFCGIDGISDSVTFGPDDCEKFKLMVPIGVRFKIEVVSVNEISQQYSIRIPSVDTDGFMKDILKRQSFNQNVEED